MFEIDNKYKIVRKSQWKSAGLVMDNFEEIWTRYINTDKCELCNKDFLKRSDRVMDHCHTTGKFRNVVCRACNNRKRDVVLSNTGEMHISKTKCSNYKQGYGYRINIKRNKKDLFAKRTKTLEDAIKCRDEFMRDNPQHFI
tara:strand:- start:63 stop:485 length:423 start_codon:yes stop_codon:yes gene_type:complete